MRNDTPIKAVIIDDRENIVRAQWEEARCGSGYNAVFLSRFSTPDEAAENAVAECPDIVFVDYIYDSPAHAYGDDVNGESIVRALREKGFTGAIYGNSSLGPRVFSLVKHLMDGCLPGKGEGMCTVLRAVRESLRK